MTADFDPGRVAEDAVRWATERGAEEAAFSRRRRRSGWQAGLMEDDRGQVIPNLANAITAFREAPELRDAFSYDEMAWSIVINRRLPGSRLKRGGGRALQDADVTAVQEWLQRAGIARVGRDTTQQAAELIAREHAFHPVRDYLNGLKWDAVPRLDTWLSYYLGAASTAYTSSIGRWFLMSLVARIMRPGCQCDYMVVFEGEQGVGKSSACRVLAGDWFSDSLPNLHNGDEKRISLHLRGKWVIEIGELSAISKAEDRALKNFLTRTVEKYTPPYGQNEVTEARQCVFVGTTNEQAYLHDETGARRYWPVKVGSHINLDDLAADRDQLFAEAVNAFRAGEHYWPDRDFEAEHIKPEQDARHVQDEWKNIIEAWLQEPEPGAHPLAYCSVADVARKALFMTESRLGTIEQRRIVAALRNLGWTQGRSSKARGWVRKLP